MSVQTLPERPPYVSFERRAVEDRTATIEAGHYVAKDIDYVLVTPQGSKDRIERVASEWLAKIAADSREGRFPPEWVDGYKRKYEMWKQGGEIPVEGSPLAHWPAISPAQLRMCQDINIRTVEDLATANEETIARIGMGGRALKQAAIAWLQTSQDTGKVAAEVAALRQQNMELAARNEELMQRLERLEAAAQAPNGKQKL